MKTNELEVQHTQNDLAVYSPNELLLKAIEGKADIGTLKELMALQKEWMAIQAKKEFDEALSKFQSIVPPIKKNKKGYDDTYNYAELDKIVEVIRKPLYECGFSYKFKFKDIKKDNPYSIDQIITVAKATDFEDKKKLAKLEKTLREIITDKDIEVTCILTHKAGHSEETTMIGPEDHSGFKNAIQARGSSTTYLERYTLIGALGLVTADVDDDGGKGRAKTPDKKPESEQSDKPAKNVLSMEQFKKTMKWMQTGVNPDTGEKKELTIETIRRTGVELTEDQLKALEVIENNKKK